MTWGLIGSRMQTKFNTQFSFQENLCLQIAFWPPFRPPLRTLSFLELRHTGEIYNWFIELHTPENFTLFDWTPILRRYLRFDPYLSDNTEWEKVIRKEDTRNNATRAKAKASTEEKIKIVMIPVFAETLTLRGDTTLLPRQHQSMPLPIFCVLLFMFMALSNRSRNNSKVWNVLFTFQSGFPGFCDMAKLCYTLPPYLWLWVNCSIFLNSADILTIVWLILPVTMNTLVCMAISTLEKSDVFAGTNG